MLKATIALMVLLAAPRSARADEGGSGVEADRGEAAPVNLFALPEPIYDETGRLLAAPPPSDVRDVRDLLLRLPTGAEPGRTAPRRRGEP